VLELSQRHAWLDSELVDHRPARLPVGLESLGLPTGAIEGEHQLAPESLAERLLGDQRLELPDELRTRAERELRVDQVLERCHAEFRQVADFVRDERLVGQIGERRPTPEPERLPQLLCPPLTRRGAALSNQALETAEVGLLRRDVEEVAARTGQQQTRPENASELCNVVLQRRSRRPRRFLAPEPVD
jgi:hypothetical protein